MWSFNGPTVSDEKISSMRKVGKPIGTQHEISGVARTYTTAFSNFHCHRSWNNITRSKIFCTRSISFHEPFTFTVSKDTTFTTGSWWQNENKVYKLPEKENHSRAEIHHQETCLQTNEFPKLSTRRKGWIYTTFSNQASSTINACRMELHKLKILQLHMRQVWSGQENANSQHSPG